MSLKDRFSRTVRANLNQLLDAVTEFEREGGFRNLVEPLAGELGFEEIGQVQRPKSGEKSLKEYYANLEVPMGADMETIKESYRRLMRKYHPDKHTGDPVMEALATELSQELTRAYQAVESYLETGHY